jgi:hypothetical protein
MEEKTTEPEEKENKVEPEEQPESLKKHQDMPKPKKSNKNLVTVLMIAIIVAIIGFAGWLAYNSQNNTKETPDSYNNSSPAATTNELTALRTFCQDSQYITYVENPNGKFGNCAITSNEGGGGMKIAKLVNSTWTTIYEGNGAFDDNLCTQYKIPKSIMSSCPGYYN